MTEAYLIENGEITDPIREGNLIGNGPQVLKDIDLLGNDFAMGMPGHVRQGRPGRAGRRRPADPAGHGAHRRRHGGLSVPDDATTSWSSPTGIAGQAEHRRAGRGRTSPAADGHRGPGLRGRGRALHVGPVRGHRHPGGRATAGMGFAYAGTLDHDAVAEVLAEARDNAAFGTPDEWAGLAEPDGVAVVEQDLWRDELLAAAHRGQDRAGQGARAAHAGRRQPGPGGRGRLRRRPGRGRRGHHHRHRAPPGRETGCYLSVSTLADDGDETQTGFGFSVGRSAGRLRPRRRRPRRRPSGPPGCWAPPSRPPAR